MIAPIASSPIASRVARLARTIAPLAPLQILMRPWALARPRVLHPLLLSTRAIPAPSLRAFARAPHGLDEHARREARRATDRCARLGAIDPRLASFERAYGRELAAQGDPHARSTWPGEDALMPYPAAVRARGLALAARLGVPGLESSLALAARAVLVQLELELLGNHLLEDALGLACAGVVTEGVEGALWYRVGAAILDHELPRQFLADGAHVERSATYHAFLLTGLLELLELHRATGRAPPSAWVAVARAALAWLDRVSPSEDAYVLFNDASDDFCPSPRHVRALAALVGIELAPRTRCLDVLRATGWVVARSRRDALVVDAGPLGPPHASGHGHADTLTFELWVNGRRLVVDAGVPRYAQGAERDWCRSTSAHNTVEIDGVSSSEVWGAFRVGRRAEAKVLHVEELDERFVLTTSHDGYEHLPGAPVHVRRFELRPGELRVHDLVTGTGRHVVVSRVRFDAEAFRASSARIAIDGAEPRVEPSVWYARHGQAEAATLAEHRFVGRLPYFATWRITWKSRT